MSSFRLTATRGDTIRIEVACTRPDEDGVQQPIDITDSTLWFTAKKGIADADAATTTIQKTSGDGIEVLDAVAGTALITLDPADTDGLTVKTTYLADVELVEADETVTTIASGKLVILLDVTRAS